MTGFSTNDRKKNRTLCVIIGAGIPDWVAQVADKSGGSDYSQSRM
jgi:hypothetical protein